VGEILGILNANCFTRAGMLESRNGYLDELKISHVPQTRMC
jgi:hypothetical protein